MVMREIYVSTDVEADGPIPGPHSMLCFGSAAYLPDKTIVSTFSANLELLPGASGHPDTMAWWEQHQDAWLVSRQQLLGDHLKTGHTGSAENRPTELTQDNLIYTLPGRRWQ